MKTIPDNALNQHIAVLGKTGSGKSYAAKGVVESLLDHARQVCVLDPTGAWWGLRLLADGRSAGYDVVLLGGKHADIPLSARSGEAVARLVTEQGASVVLDTSGMTVGEYTRFFIDFAGTLYTTIRNPLHLIIDEAHYFMPQNGAKDVDTGKMIHAGNRLMSGGRSLGVRGMMITQRPAKLHKDSLTCADTLVAMRVIAPQDRKAIQDWVDGCGDPAQGKEVMGSLASLAKGEGWVWYPEGGYLHRTKFPTIKTYDSSATPKHGAKDAPQVKEINLDDVRAAMADAVAEAEANDPKKLRARIAELEKGVKAEAPAVDVAAFQDSAYRSGQLATSNVILNSIRTRVRALNTVQENLRVACEAVEVAVGAIDREVRSLSSEAPVPRPPAKPTPNGQYTSVVTADGIAPRHLRILAAIAWFESFAGIDIPTRAMVAARAGVSSTSSSYANDLSAMKTAGLIGYPSTGNLNRTDAGKRIAVDLPDGDAWESLPAIVDPRHMNMLRTLRRGRMSRSDLANAVDASPSSSSFANDLSKLRTLALIDYPAPGEVELAEWLRGAA